MLVLGASVLATESDRDSPIGLISSQNCVLYFRFWKGGESLPFRKTEWGRKVRTPQGAMPRNLQGAERHGCEIYAGGGPKGKPTESATENIPPLEFQISNLKFQR